MEEYKLYIDGEWVKSESRETFSRVNPANIKDNLGKFQSGDERDVRAAVDAASRAFEKWREVPAPTRGKILLKAAKILEENKEELARTMTIEKGKILKESRGDVQEAIDMMEYMAGEGRRFFGRTTTSELKKKFSMTVRMPLGVVACITPWNFPIAIPAWKLSAALISGNTVVLKPSSDTPICATKLVEVLERAGVPRGVVNMVTGSGSVVGNYLAKHKEVRAVSFTGHRDTGNEITKAAGGNKRVGLEMGSKNAIIVMDDADLDLAIEGVLWGAFGTTGQRCTACSRVIVNEKIKQKFMKMLVFKTERLKVGDGLKPDTDVGPLVNHTARDKVMKYIEIGKEEGAKIICGGGSSNTKGWFVDPTIFDDATISMRISREEIFGPVLSIIISKNLDDAIDKANSVDYGLSSSVYTNNIKNMMESVEKLDFGITYINAPTIGAEVHLPFGGVKHSGNGWKEAGWTGLQFFSEEKTVYIDYSGKLQKAQIDSKK